jgi:hypothetical protein
MRTGRLKFVTKGGKPFFPVTRAEGVIYRDTTVAKTLDEHGRKIGKLRTDVDAIVRITDTTIEEIAAREIGGSEESGE